MSPSTKFLKNKANSKIMGLTWDLPDEAASRVIENDSGLPQFGGRGYGWPRSSFRSGPHSKPGSSKIRSVVAGVVLENGLARRTHYITYLISTIRYVPTDTPISTPMQKNMRHWTRV